MASQIQFKQVVRQQIQKYQPQPDRTYLQAFYDSISETTQKCARLEPTKNRREIYDRLHNLIVIRATDDELLKEYCRSYGTIVYGINLESDLDKSMTKTLFHEIREKTYTFNFSNPESTKTQVFFRLWYSLIQRAYNLDNAAITCTKATEWGKKALSLFLFKMDPLIGSAAFLAQTNEKSKQDVTFGKIQPIFCDESSLNTILTETEMLLSKSLEKEIVNLPLEDVVCLAFCSYQELGSRMINDSDLLQQADQQKKVNWIFDTYRNCFNEAIKTFTKNPTSEKSLEENERVIKKQKNEGE